MDDISNLTSAIAKTLLEQANKVFDNVRPSTRFCVFEGDKLVGCCGIYALGVAKDYYQKGMVVNDYVISEANNKAYNAMAEASAIALGSDSRNASVVDFFNTLPKREAIESMFLTAKTLVV
jgi:hypothetical protein